jgi:3alpha(or 20beta)-hydroxysteroid dehydrogenase
MGNSLLGQVVLVTGGARGMGAEHVRGLVRAGARVLAGDVLDDAGRSLAGALGSAVEYMHLDVTDERQWAAAVARAESAFGPVNHLVNNAGVLTLGSIEQTAPEVFRRTLEVNLTGAWLGMRAAIPSLRRAGGGSIVNVSSTAGLQGFANLGAYGASKWGLRGLTKTAALELGSMGIRVNLLHPGPIRTPMIEGLGPDLASRQPIARMGEPAEVTAMLLFLLAEATYSTGGEFTIDGGAALGPVTSAIARR